MKINLVAFFIICTTGVFSQSIENLNQVGGFKEFKIGDLKSKWLPFLRPDKSSKYDDYYYTGSNIKTAFGHEISWIILRFNSEHRLQFIMISLENEENIIGLAMLNRTILEAFGETTGKNDNPPQAFVKFWKGDNITLCLDGTYNISNGLYVIMLTYVDNKFYENNHVNNNDY
jgi:hypothetical protein